MRSVLSVLLLAATATAASAGPKCLERDGRCMAVSVNGQQAVKLSKRTKALLRSLQQGANSETRYEIGQTLYEVPQAIRGAVQVEAERGADSGDWFGEGRAFETMVFPLDQVDLTTRRELATSDDVRVGGAAPVVAQDVTDNRLPPGRYLLIVRLSGRGNWDRMTLYVQVEE